MLAKRFLWLIEFELTTDRKQDTKYVIANAKTSFTDIGRTETTAIDFGRNVVRYKVHMNEEREHQKLWRRFANDDCNIDGFIIICPFTKTIPL